LLSSLPGATRASQISRRPLLQMARSGFLLAATLFVMLALRFMALVDVSAIVWVAPVLVTALSGIFLHERVTPAAWTGVAIGLIDLGSAFQSFDFCRTPFSEHNLWSGNDCGFRRVHLHPQERNYLVARPAQSYAL
jgi:hypothetical protein